MSYNFRKRKHEIYNDACVKLVKDMHEYSDEELLRVNTALTVPGVLRLILKFRGTLCQHPGLQIERTDKLPHRQVVCEDGMCLCTWYRTRRRTRCPPTAGTKKVPNLEAYSFALLALRHSLVNSVPEVHLVPFLGSSAASPALDLCRTALAEISRQGNYAVLTQRRSVHIYRLSGNGKDIPVAYRFVRSLPAPAMCYWCPEMSLCGNYFAIRKRNAATHGLVIIGLEDPGFRLPVSEAVLAVSEAVLGTALRSSFLKLNDYFVFWHDEDMGMDCQIRVEKVDPTTGALISSQEFTIDRNNILFMKYKWRQITGNTAFIFGSRGIWIRGEGHTVDIPILTVDTLPDPPTFRLWHIRPPGVQDFHTLVDMDAASFDDDSVLIAVLGRFVVNSDNGSGHDLPVYLPLAAPPLAVFCYNVNKNSWRKFILDDQAEQLKRVRFIPGKRLLAVLGENSSSVVIDLSLL